jgi:hypothetical protein
MMVSDFGNGSGTVPELSESPIELVFSRDCLIIRSPVVVPLKGRSLHEERVGYNEIPSGCLNMQVKSIEKQEENDQLKALVFKVNRFVGNGSGTVPELSESPIELVFSRDCLIIRSPVVVPLKGRSLHEERVGYNEIPSGCLNMQVKSIEKQEENDQLKALVFKVNRFEQASEEQKTDKEKQTSASVLVISQGCIEYSYLNVSICRSIFPGYRVPFVLVTDQGNISAYVGNAQKDTRIGAPLIGSTMLGLKQWYSAHPEIEVGDTVLIETIEPKKRYRLSLLGHTDQSEPPFAEEIHSDTSSLPTTLVLRKKKA